MNWSLFDFAFFGAMVLGVVVVALLARRKSRSPAYRFAAGVALMATFLIVWVTGAVGIIGDEGNDANLMFFGVLAIGVVGSLIARFRPVGMSRAMFATAVAHAAVAVIAVVGKLGVGGAAWPWDVVVSTAFFVMLWLLSSWLFRKAARRLYPGELRLRG